MRFDCTLVLFRSGIFVRRTPASVDVSPGQLEVHATEAAEPGEAGFIVTPTQVKKVEFNLANSMVTFLPERRSDMRKMALSFADVGFLAAAKNITVGDDGTEPGLEALKEWVVANQVRADEYRVSARGRSKTNRLA